MGQKITDIKPEEINTVTLENIQKFLNDHPEIPGYEIRRRIQQYSGPDGIITPKGGVILEGRKGIIQIMSALMPMLIKDVANDPAHHEIIIKNCQEYEMCLKYPK